VLLGKTEYMRSSLAALRQNAAGGQKDLQRSAKESSAPIVTYANDEARINNCFDVVAAAGTQTF